MGIDKSLHDDYPKVVINGTKYHFGRELKYGQYLVEHTRVAKDYWCFDRRDDMLAFLVNLPESADRNRRWKLYPDWQEVTPEQRHAYIEEDRARLRELMEEKRRAGTAKEYPVYPDDGTPSFRDKPPFNPAADDKEPPLERVERQLREYKETHRRPLRDTKLPPGSMGDLIHGLTDHSFESGLTEAGKLAVLERLDWSGVGDQDKAAILAREVDFKGLTKEQFEFVYEDLEDDREEPVNDRAARKLFERANVKAGVEKPGPVEREGATVGGKKPRGGNAADKHWRLLEIKAAGHPVPDGFELPPYHEPPAASSPDRLRRVEAEIAALKQARFTSWELVPLEGGAAVTPAVEGRWEDLAELGKVSAMDHWVDWGGVSWADRGATLTRHVDVQKIPASMRAELGQQLQEPLLDGVAVRFRGIDCTLRERRYGNGRVALELIDRADGESAAVATVNLPHEPLGRNEVFVKDYSENAGMLAALEAAGVVRPTGRTAAAGFATVAHCELVRGQVEKPGGTAELQAKAAQRQQAEGQSEKPKGPRMK